MSRSCHLLLQMLLAAPLVAQPTIVVVAGNGTDGFSGDGGPAISAALARPHGLALDAAGNLYIADYNNMRVRKVSLAGTITTVAGNGIGDFNGDGAATESSLYLPRGVAVDGTGNLYIADTQNDRVRKVTPNGMITTVAGGGPCCSLGDGGPATRARFVWPMGVAVDASGNIYVADHLVNRARKVTPHGKISTVAGYGAIGNTGDGGSSVSARLSFPVDVAVDTAGSLYVLSGGRVRKVGPSGTISTVFSHGTGSAGTGIAVDGAGDLYVAAGYSVFKATTAGIVTTVATFSGRLNDVAVDSSGNLYVSDGESHRVYRVTQ